MSAGQAETAIAESSKIKWADHTFNPRVDCTEVSRACHRCYAESWAKRTGNAALWQRERRRTMPENWCKLLRWYAAVQGTGVRPRLVCASLADVFDNKVPNAWRSDGIVNFSLRSIVWRNLSSLRSPLYASNGCRVPPLVGEDCKDSFRNA